MLAQIAQRGGVASAPGEEVFINTQYQVRRYNLAVKEHSLGSKQNSNKSVRNVQMKLLWNENDVDAYAIY